MKRWLALAAVAAAIGCSTVEEQMVSSLLQNYVTAQRALAADDSEKAGAAFRALSEEVEAELKEVALMAAESGDIAVERKAFKTLSDWLLETDLPKGYVVAYCPMADEGKGASWIQKDGDIANPYFGKEMQDCGEVTRTGGS